MAMLDMAMLLMMVIMISYYIVVGSLAKSIVGVCQQHPEASAAQASAAQVWKF